MRLQVRKRYELCTYEYVFSKATIWKPEKEMEENNDTGSSTEMQATTWTGMKWIKTLPSYVFTITGVTAHVVSFAYNIPELCF
jgi:hypothetical protein